MDISKVAYEIHKCFYQSRNERDFELWPSQVFNHKDQYELAGATLDDIHEAFSLLKQKSIIISSNGSDRCTITSTGKQTPPEYLIWKEQEEAHDKLDQKMKARKLWVYGFWAAPGMVFLLFLAFFYIPIFRVWLSPYTDLTLAVLGVMIVSLFITFGRKAGDPPPYEDLIFAKMWEAYGSLRSSESELSDESNKKEELKKCIEMLDDAAEIMRIEEVSRSAIVNDKIFGMFRKLGTYVKDTVIPSLKERKAEKVRAHIVEIGALLLKRDIPGLIDFVNSLGKIEVPMEKRRIPSLSELTARPGPLFMLAAVAFLLFIWLGHYLISVYEKKPLMSYASDMLHWSVVALVPLVVWILSRRSRGEPTEKRKAS